MKKNNWVRNFKTSFSQDSRWKEETNLSGLLGGASLTLGVGHGGGLLSGLGRLSLRKEDQRSSPSRAASSLNSRENMSDPDTIFQASGLMSQARSSPML